jgi:alpha-galactosidase
MAVGLFNRGNSTATVKVTWVELKLNGRQPVRDLWQQKDLGIFKDAFETSVPVHGAVLVKIGSPQGKR